MATPICIKLNLIYKKYSAIATTAPNYRIGGGLSENKFASRRHEDAKNDSSRITVGRANQLFKKATGLSVKEVKEIIDLAIPDKEWHHAGKLPKSYGGGMKKTYFLTSTQIADLAKHWTTYQEQLKVKKTNAKKALQIKQAFEKKKAAFLKKYATRVIRSTFINIKNKELFYETDQEMDGKYGWFSAYNSVYNLTIYYSGWQFRSKAKYAKFHDFAAPTID